MVVTDHNGKSRHQVRQIEQTDWWRSQKHCLGDIEGRCVKLQNISGPKIGMCRDDLDITLEVFHLGPEFFSPTSRMRDQPKSHII